MKHEDIDFSLLSLGAKYKRSDLLTILNIQNVFPTGIREFNNCIFFYVTLDKSNKPTDHKYNDYFESQLFFWESQKQQDSNSPVLQKIINNELVPYLFVRINENDFFTYLGSLSFISYDEETSNPVQFSFETLNFSEMKLEPSHEFNINKILGHYPGEKGTRKEFKEKSKRKAISNSQGYESDPEIKKAVEMRAMNAAIDYYKSKDYTVEDVSGEKIGYDIRCTFHGEELRVEIKGTRSNGNEVLLTKNEVINAKNFNTSLFILHSITIDKETKIASGGIHKIIDDWIPDENHLIPLTYKYKVPK